MYGDDVMDRETAVAVKMPGLTLDQNDRAIAGFRLYFGQLPGFSEKLARFTQGHAIELPVMPYREVRVWRRRLAEWEVVLVEDAA